MFLTTEKTLAEQYMRRDSGSVLQRELMTFDLKSYLCLIDITTINTNKLARLAQDIYGVEQVGQGDLPVRNHMLETIRNIFGEYIDGTISNNNYIFGNEIHLDSISMRKINQVGQ